MATTKKKAAKKKAAAKKTAAKKKAAKKKTSKRAPKWEPVDEAEALKGRAFSPQEVLFCEAYVGRARFNQSKAAKLAGYGEDGHPDSVRSIAYALMRRPHIKKRIELLKQEQIEQLKMTPDEVEAEWGAIARMDIRNLFDERGRLLDADKMDDNTARSVVSIKVREEFDGPRGDREHVADIIEIKLADKNAALSNYARALGMFKDVVQIDPSESLKKILEDIDGSSVGPPALRSKSGGAGEGQTD